MVDALQEASPSLTSDERHLAGLLWRLQWTTAENLQQETSLAVDVLLRDLEEKGIVNSFPGRRSVHANGDDGNAVTMYQLTALGNRLCTADPPARSLVDLRAVMQSIGRE